MPSDPFAGFDPAFRYAYECSCGRKASRIFAIETEAAGAAKRHARHCVRRSGKTAATRILKIPWK